MSEIESRHFLEERWHDKKVKDTRGDQLDLYAMGALCLADAYAWDLLGDVSRKTVVDFGCGGGQNAVRLAERGATVYAFDISSAMVEVARRRVLETGLQGQVFVDKMAAEQLTYPDRFCDIVFGHSILHHTDLALTRREVHRILRPGGRAVFLEPLGHNPFINVFRRFTPSRRTPTERPLRFQDVYFFAEPFSSLQHREFYLLSLMALVLAPLRNRVLFRTMLDILGRADDVLLARQPGLGKYAWVVVLEVVK